LTDIVAHLTRTAAALAALLALAPCGASADPPWGFMSGNQLLAACDASTDACAAYVMGVMDMADLAKLSGHMFCVPHGVIAKQLDDIVARALREHPEDRQAGAASLVLLAVSHAWPCPGR
jgi:hypothetical protein